MPTFKFSHTQVHRVHWIFSEEFDTEGQDDWDVLKSKARDRMDEDEFESLPDVAPEDVDVWRRVYSFVEASELSDKEEDWVTDRKGDYESFFEVSDEDGNVLSEG